MAETAGESCGTRWFCLRPIMASLMVVVIISFAQGGQGAYTIRGNSPRNSRRLLTAIYSPVLERRFVEPHTGNESPQHVGGTWNRPLIGQNQKINTIFTVRSISGEGKAGKKNKDSGKGKTGKDNEAKKDKEKGKGGEGGKTTCKSYKSKKGKSYKSEKGKSNKGSKSGKGKGKGKSGTISTAPSHSTFAPSSSDCLEPTPFPTETSKPTQMPEPTSPKPITTVDPTSTSQPTTTPNSLRPDSPGSTLAPTTTPQPTVTQRPTAPAPASQPTKTPQPTTTSKPTVTAAPSAAIVVHCDAIANGTATTDADQARFDLGLELVVIDMFAFEGVTTNLLELFQTRVAPRVALCPVSSGSVAAAQTDDAATVVNVLFLPIRESLGGTCTWDGVGATCFATDSVVDIYHDGGKDTSTFRQRLIDAINAERPFNIPGLVDIINISASPNLGQMPSPTETAQPTVTPRPTLTPAPSSMPSTTPQPTRTPKPTVTAAPSAAIVVDCDAIANGTATTDADQAKFDLGLELVIIDMFTFEGVVTDLLELFQTQVALRVALCPVSSGGVAVPQTDDAATVVNVLFLPIRESLGGTCTSDAFGATCFATDSVVDIYHDGEDTSTFQQRLTDAINEERPFNIPGLVDIINISATPNFGQTPSPTETAQPTVTPRPSLTPAPSSLSMPSTTPQPTMTFKPTATAAPSTSIVVDCDAIANGTASMHADKARFDLGLELVIIDMFTFEGVAADLLELFQTRVAPRVALCPVSSGGVAAAQTSDTAIVVNVLFSPIRESLGGTCAWDAVGATCFATDSVVDIYHDGGEDTSTFQQRLTDAINEERPFNIPGLVDIISISATPNFGQTLSPTETAQPTVTTRPALTPAPSSMPSTTPQPTATSKPTMTAAPSAGIFVDCDAIANGTATTDADKARFDLGLELVIIDMFTFEGVVTDLLEMFQTQVAPRVALCPVSSGGVAVLQSDDAATVVNVLFLPIRESLGGTCTSDVVGTKCFATDSVVDIYHEGGEDTSAFQQRLTDAINSERPFNISGLVDIISISGTPNLGQMPSPTETAQPTETPGPTVTPATSSTSSSPTFTPTPTFMPTVTRLPTSSPAPATTPAPSGSAIFVDCDAIANGTATMDADRVRLGLGLELVINTFFTFEEVVEDLLTLFQRRVSLRVALCPVPPREGRPSRGGRGLQGEEENGDEAAATVVNALFSPFTQSLGVNCTTDIVGSTCFPTNSIVDIYYKGGKDTSTFQQRLIDAINAERPFNIPGLRDIVNITVVEVDGDGGVVGVVTDRSSDDDSIRAGGIVGIVGGSLLLLLLLLLLLRRRRTAYIVKHQELLDDDEDLLLKDMEADTRTAVLSSPSTPGRQPTPDRLARVVGETDSIATGWTGYSPDKSAGTIVDDLEDDDMSPTRRLYGLEAADPSKGLDRPDPSRDVHKCSSATCEVCERRRQEGLLFVSTGTPLRHQSLPPDAQREYLAEDTVHL